jgi:hypothetical protein
MIGGDDTSADLAQGVEWGAQLPRVLLLHGTGDTCALFSNATSAAQLQGSAAWTQAKSCCLLLLCKGRPGEGNLDEGGLLMWTQGSCLYTSHWLIVAILVCEAWAEVCVGKGFWGQGCLL